MKFDGISILEGSTIENLTVVSGVDFPINPELGELFYKINDGLFVYNDLGVWEKTNYIPEEGPVMVEWGDISGTLSSQTDLQTQLNNKLNSDGNATTATTATYLTTTQLNARVTGHTNSLAMALNDTENNGSFVSRSSGTGDSNMAGISFHNDAYGIKMGVRADGYFGLGGWTRSAWSWYSSVNGDMVAAGNVTAYSDPRLKEKFQNVENPLGIISQLNGGTFNWKHGFSHTAVKAGKKDYGVLADEVESVMPEIISESIDIDGEKYKMVSYEKLVPVLIEAIKELEQRLTLLENK